jgi:protein gp37
MAQNSAISWTDHTWNPWMGCSKVSPACDGCYAEALMDHRFGQVSWGNHPRRRTSVKVWNDPYRWQKQAEENGTRPFVFCASLSDIFDNQVDPKWRTEAFEVMRKTPNLIYLLLTKRPQNIAKLSAEAGGLPANAAIGTTVEDRKRAFMNVSALLNASANLALAKTSALFNFISGEPLLEEFDLTDIPYDRFSEDKDGYRIDALRGKTWLPVGVNKLKPGVIKGDREYVGLTHRIHWVITGGETDQHEHKARPSHPNAFRALRDQCAEAGVPFHHKQNGEWLEVSAAPSNALVHRFEDGVMVQRLGKRHTGRLLDGRTHDEFPSIRAA